MKHIRYTKLFGWLAAATLLLTTSCKDDLFGNHGSSDEVTVSFTLTPEAVAPATRATNHGGHVTYPDGEDFPHISDGSKADVLIYAVYDSEGNLLTGYSNGIDPSLPEHFKGNRPGQTIEKIDYFPHTIRLTLKRGETYTVAFWAQNSECQAYNTADLQKVEVIYSELEDKSSDAPARVDENGTTPEPTTTPNNDERRDAFCRSVQITAGESESEQTVWLYRPLAQINVGTSGYDFETITRNAKKKYLYSKIRLNRVARYLDVVEDKTYSSTTDENDSYSQEDSKKTSEAFAVADFGFAPLPAYINRPLKLSHIPEYPEDTPEEERVPVNEIEDGYENYPLYPSYTIWDWAYNPDFDDKFPHHNEGVLDRNEYKITKTNYTGEEFLKVHLYDHNEITAGDKDATGKAYNVSDIDNDGYWDYANLTNHDEELSETFKYLSMCYVLTSSTKQEHILINNVKVWLATDELGSDSIEIINLNYVPAQRNYRTNIVGNLLTEEATFSVTLDQNFAGEYNGLLHGDAAEWSGPLAKGVYYDAAKDEILISDRDGLLWFQKMVNGDLCVREAKASSEKGKAYPYYEYNKETDEYVPARYLEKDDEWKGYHEEDYKNDETLKQRILKATHQKEWPKHGNFPFCGEDGPAHVKLMADIDLKGIEWIPIGFDFKVHDGTVGGNKTYQYIDYNGTGKTDVSEFQRVFRGIFDGNDHTIRNLSSKRFSIEIRDEALQSGGTGPYDNVQWFPAGFFGLVAGWGGTNKAGEQTTIKNLRLFNVDVYGCHTAAAVAAIVSSPENDCTNSKMDYAVNITNCRVDVGTITLSPMHRGDQYNKRDRTFARGIYGGGIVGQFSAKGSITDCEVRGVTIRGYRQIGGLVGSISNTDFKDSSGNAVVAEKLRQYVTISGNRIDNSLIIADKFQPYDIIFNWVENGVWRNGFGWVETQPSLANTFVGGTARELYAAGNSKGDVQCVEFRTGVTSGSKARQAEIGSVPLSYIPMLSSWFCDTITLTGNYYGETSIYVGREYMEGKEMFHPYTEHYPNEAYRVPFQLPYSTSINYKKNTPKAAMYVESVTLDGGGTIGGRSVITPDNLTDTRGACVMYVTSRDRKQFFENLSVSLSPEGGFRYGSSDDKTFNVTPKDNEYIKSTNIRNVVLRGAPYAYIGMSLAPHSNMDSVKLHKVAIYDVYRTLSLDPSGVYTKDKDANVTLQADSCNFRGYTVPGADWAQINYQGTTFEEGTFISSLYKTDEKKKEARTYKVETSTSFKGCFFKAPYIIDLTEMQKNGKLKDVDFGEATQTDLDAADEKQKKAIEKGYSKAAATSKINKQIKLKDARGNLDLFKTDCTHIVITADAQGVPVITYYKDYGKPGQHVLLVE